MEDNSTSTQLNITLTAGFYLQHALGWSIFISIVLSLISIACIVGNSLVILAVMLVHKLKTPCNYLIVSLAVSDWLVGVIVNPMSIAYVLLGQWPFGSTICSMWVFLDVLLCTASILNLMMISIDRYLVITRPFQYSEKRTAKLMVLYITIAWIVSSVISATPILVGWKPVTENGQCLVNQRIEYQVYAVLGAFYLPLLVMIGLYGKIFYISRKIAKAEAKNNPTALTVPIDNNNTDHALDGMEIGSSSDVSVKGSHCNSTTHSLHEPERVWLRVDDHQYCDGNGIHKHRAASWPFKKVSSATLASVKRFLHRRKFKGNSHAIKTLGVIMGLFTACWLPFFVLAVVRPLCRCDVPSWVYDFLTWLGYLNSCLNPLIYARFNREFRIPFREILCCRCNGINELIRQTDYLDQYGS